MTANRGLMMCLLTAYMLSTATAQGIYASTCAPSLTPCCSLQRQGRQHMRDRLRDVLEPRPHLHQLHRHPSHNIHNVRACLLYYRNRQLHEQLHAKQRHHERAVGRLLWPDSAHQPVGHVCIEHVPRYLLSHTVPSASCTTMPSHTSPLMHLLASRH